MTPAPSLMSCDDYFAKTPETVKPAELAFGVFRVAESPTARHQSAVLRLLLALDAHVRARDMGQMWVAPLDVVLDRERALIVQPDLFFVSNNRAWIVGDRVDGPPDLVIEVLSPTPRIGRTEEHVKWFAEYRVRECWLVRQNQRSLSVIDFADGRIARRREFTRKAAIESSVLPGFTLSLDDILD